MKNNLKDNLTIKKHKVNDLINGLNPDIICNDCINKEEMIAHDDYDRFD